MEMGEVMTDALPSNRNIQNSSFSTPHQESQEDAVEREMMEGENKNDLARLTDKENSMDMDPKTQTEVARKAVQVSASMDRNPRILSHNNRGPDGYSSKPQKHEIYDMRGHKYRRPFPREGTQKDVDDLTATFSQIGYKVKTYKDYTHDRIISTVKDISNQDHSGTSCVWIVVLTHGKEGSKFCAADKYYKLSELEQLLQDGNLVGKPKVMLLQVCRAGHVDSGKSLRLSSGKVVMNPTPADSLVIHEHATYNDYYAFRNDGGTFLINAVCAALQEHSELTYGDFNSAVNQKVASRTSYSTTDPLCPDPQIPETRITLSKSLVFKGCKKVGGSSKT